MTEVAVKKKRRLIWHSGMLCRELNPQEQEAYLSRLQRDNEYMQRVNGSEKKETVDEDIIFYERIMRHE